MQRLRWFLAALLLVTLAAVNQVLASPEACYTNCGRGAALDSWEEPNGNCTITNTCYVSECDRSCDGEDFLHYKCQAGGLNCGSIPDAQ